MMAKRFIEHHVTGPRGASPAGPPSRAAVGKSDAVRTADKRPGVPREIGGPEGPEPTRFGDWERKGICVDF